MHIQKQDKTNAENLIKLLRRSKIELDGAEEILATAEILKWMAQFLSRIDKDLGDQELQKKALEAAMTAKELPAMNPVSTPAAQETKTKKAKKE